MPDQGGAQVALFIDWDNIAISTAADHGGAIPDLRRIVQVAQSYGTLVIARAYAEWGITSDRLAVYRAGVEPVYAPTFRFEADVPGQPSRGKSLADPCLVADCVDAMHMHDGLTHYVLVSGDKDLVPVVRLAQMRGKRVIVIGPDLVAAVLRDMADEYVPYRSIVGTTAGGPLLAAAARAEADERGRRRRRRGGRGGERAPAAGEVAGPAEEVEDVEPIEPAPRPRREPRERRPFVDRAGIFGTRPAEDGPSEQSAEVAAEAELPLAPPEPPRERARPEPRVERVEERREPPRREPEPVRAEPPAAPTPARLEPPAAPVPARLEPPVVPIPARLEPPVAPAPVAASGDAVELWGTIAQILKERTGVGRPRLRATNLKDYLLARVPGFSEQRYGFGRFKDLLGAAEAAGVLVSTDVGQVQWISLPEEGGAPAVLPAPAAPTALPVESANAAVADDPAVAAARAIDAAEAIAAIVDMRHRTRLLTQSYVLSNLGAVVAARAPGAPPDETARALVDRLVDEGSLRVDREPQEVDMGNGVKHRVRLVHLVDDSGLVRRAEEEWAHRSGESAVSADATATSTTEQPAAKARANGRTRGRRGGRGGGAATAEAAAPEAVAPAEPPAAEEAPAPPEPTPPTRGRGRRSRGAAAQEAAEPAAAPAGEPPAAAGIERVYEVLVDAVRDGIAPGKDTAGAAGVKSRLTAALGSFNERDFGFSKFKDFLEAAQRAGKVRVETAGAATRVGLP